VNAVKKNSTSIEKLKRSKQKDSIVACLLLMGLSNENLLAQENGEIVQSKFKHLVALSNMLKGIFHRKGLNAMAILKRENWIFMLIILIL
jgi:hypothetical protein